jgi:hypothetical protein
MATFFSNLFLPYQTADAVKIQSRKFQITQLKQGVNSNFHLKFILPYKTAKAVKIQSRKFQVTRLKQGVNGNLHLQSKSVKKKLGGFAPWREIEFNPLSEI